MAGFVVATLVDSPGAGGPASSPSSSRPSPGSLTGIGVGVFRVHPLIMTLGMSLVVLGLANVWQLQMVQTGSGVPGLAAVARVRHDSHRVVPNSLLVFVPVAAFILLRLRRTGYGRLLYAIGDNPVASRLSGARAWQVLIVLYMISARPRGDRRVPVLGPHQRRQRVARRHVGPAVGRGGGHRRDVDHGRPRRLRRHDRRRAHPDGAHRRSCRRSGSPRPCARSSSARSSSSSRPPTPASPRSPEARAGSRR